MKKDIDWLKREIDELPVKFFGFSMLKQREEFAVNKYDVFDLINQLDEPEVLSQEWIDEHSNGPSRSQYVWVDDLKELLVPKQEELEAKIQELIEAYKQEEDAYSNPENGWISGFIEDLKNLVEKEQKYVIDTDDAEISDGNHYLTHLSLSKDDTELPIVGYKDDAIRFDNKEQAQAIADYVGGRVEELEE